MIRAIWKSLGSINLAIWLLVLIAFNLAVGSVYARLYPEVIGRLDYLRFQDWISPDVLSTGWWILPLFLLLFLLGVNTAVCTAEKMLFLFRRKKNTSSLFSLELAPSLLHACFVFAILGHALSQFTWEEIKMPVHPGTAVALSTGSLTVDNPVCTNREEPGLKDMVEQCSATLTLRHSGQNIRKEVSILQPVFWEDYGIHLKISGNPQPGETPGLLLVIRKDPGLMPMFWGGALFCVILVWYVLKIFKFRGGD